MKLLRNQINNNFKKTYISFQANSLCFKNISFKIGNYRNTIINNNIRSFSSTEKPTEEQTKHPMKLFLEEQKKLDNDEEKYLDKVEYYHVEFGKMYCEHIVEQLKVLSKHLGPESKELCNDFVSELMYMQQNEKNLFNLFLKQLYLKYDNKDITKINRSDPYQKSGSTGFWPKDNPNWSNMSMSGGGGGSGAKAAASATEEKVEEVKVEKKVSFNEF